MVAAYLQFSFQLVQFIQRLGEPRSEYKESHNEIHVGVFNDTS